MKMLHRALFRDLFHLRAQVLTLALVVACGASVFVAMQRCADALSGARASYFRAQRLADVFGSLKRAPRTLLSDLDAVSGVAQIDGRVVGDVPVFLDGRAQPATVHLVSLDPAISSPLDAVRLRSGRLPAPGAEDEIVLNEPFAQANHLVPGDSLSAVVSGRMRRLAVVGVGISPEFVFQLPPGALSPNDSRYGVAWMELAPLEAAFDLRGAFNDLLVRLAPGASEGAVIAALDQRLAAYGGRGTYGRDQQMSARFLDGKIKQIQGMVVVVPALFLLVAAFVLQVVLGRLVQSQREQIGTLKAFGYPPGRLARHYLSLALLALSPGALLGLVGGSLLGNALVKLYLTFFRLPLAPTSVDWVAIGGALAVVTVAAAAGALSAVRQVLRLQPVEAMRPPAPRVYRTRRRARRRAGSPPLFRRVPAALLMVARNLRLAPVRAGASVVALAFATGLCVSGTFMNSAIDTLIHRQFDAAMREDLTAAFTHPIDPRACESLRALSGVIACEPLAQLPVRVRLGPRSQRVAVTGLASHHQLRRVIGGDGEPVPVPASGLLASRQLLLHLHAQVGDRVELENLEGRPRRLSLPIRAAVDDQLGLNLYASLPTIAELLGESPVMTAALLRVAPGREAEVTRRLGELPSVVGVTRRAGAIEDFEKTQAQAMRAMTVIMALLAAILAIAVVYNGARVALAERARDLASLRVLGFSRGEVARILFGEMAFQLAIGIPLGLLLGNGLAHLTIYTVPRDDFRIPLVITTGTYLLAALVVLGASLASALHLRRLIDRLDLVEVLKTRE
ncbi:MAG TPA: ABC transporter permease [Polyangia bacterium]